MNISSNGKNLIKKYEGYNLNVYADISGYPTVGYGHLLTRSRTYTPNKNLSQADANKELKAAGLSYTSPITSAQAESLFNDDITGPATAVNNLSCSSRLTQNQFDSLSSFVFNGGATGVLGSKDVKTLLNCDETFKDFIGAINVPVQNDRVSNAFTYIYSGGNISQGLINRRNEEAELFCTGMRYSYYPIQSDGTHFKPF